MISNEPYVQPFSKFNLKKPLENNKTLIDLCVHMAKIYVTFPINRVKFCSWTISYSYKSNQIMLIGVNNNPIDFEVTWSLVMLTAEIY